MRKGVSGFLVLSALFGSMHATVANAEWHRAVSTHFVVYADMPADDIERYAQRLEAFDSALRAITSAKTTTPVTIYVVRDVSEVQRLFGARGSVAGFYTGNAQGPLAITPENVFQTNQYRLSAEAILFHEYAHHMLLTNNEEYLPGWVSEGMAEFFMSAIIKDGAVTIGAPNSIRGLSISSPHRWSARELLSSDSKKISKREVEQKYARGWLLVHYLLLGGKREGQLSNYVKQLNAGVPALEAGGKVFGDLDELDRELERYRKSSTFNTVTFSSEGLKADYDVAVNELDKGEAAIIPLRMQSARGVSREQAIDLVAKGRVVQTRYPDEAFVNRTLAEMEYDANYLVEAEVAADRTLAIDPRNIMAMLYKGRVHGKRAVAEESPEEWRTARKWILAANRVDPNYALPFVLNYDSFVAEGVEVPDSAVTGLLRAIVLVPQDSSLHLRIAMLRMAQGDIAGVREALAPVAFDPHAGSDNPALKVVRLIDSGADATAVRAEMTEAKFNQINEFVEPKPTTDEEGDEEGD